MSVDERVGVLLPVTWALEARRLPRLGADTRLPLAIEIGPVGRWPQEPHAVFEDMRGDENTAALTAFQQAFPDELLVSQHNRVASDAKLLSQLARGRQPRARRKRSSHDAFHQFLAYLVLQAQTACRIQVKKRLGHRPLHPRFMMRDFWRSQSRSFSVLRLSCWRLPLASPISTLALPRDQYMAVGTTV